MNNKKCKKCGCELPSTAKKNICESCRRRRNDSVLRGGGFLAGVAVVVGAVIKGVLGNKKE